MNLSGAKPRNRQYRTSVLRGESLNNPRPLPFSQCSKGKVCALDHSGDIWLISIAPPGWDRRVVSTMSWSFEHSSTRPYWPCICKTKLNALVGEMLTGQPSMPARQCVTECYCRSSSVTPYTWLMPTLLCIDADGAMPKVDQGVHNGLLLSGESLQWFFPAGPQRFTDLHVKGAEMACRPGCFCWAQTCGVLLVQAAFFVRSASAGGPTAARCANTGSHKTFSSLPSESEKTGPRSWLKPGLLCSKSSSMFL